jgi:uncharacterized protein (DUF2062 family)
MPSFLQRRIVAPIRSQLTQGADPGALSRAFACGVVCGVFPILGTTGLVGALAGALFKWNQAVIHALHWLLYPAHLLLIPVYIRAGEWLYRDEPVPFSLPGALRLFLESPPAFFSRYGMSCVHCLSAWAVTVPPMFLLVAAVARPLIERAAGRKSFAA